MPGKAWVRPSCWYLTLIPITDKRAETVASRISRLFLRYGVPDVLYSDPGTEFANHLQAQMARDGGYRQKFTLPAAPWSNQVERIHRTVGQLLRMETARDPEVAERWDEALEMVEITLNNRVSDSTGFTPRELWLRNPARMPADLVCRLTHNEQEPEDFPEFRRRTNEQLVRYAEHISPSNARTIT